MISLNISRKIFGISMEIKLNNQKAYNTLNSELRNYPPGDKSEITINQVENFETEILSSNPKIHIETNDGFIIKNILISIHFKFKNNAIYEVDFILNEIAGVKSNLRKWANIQFTNRTDNIGQILHETIFTSLMFLRKDRMLTHASAIQLINNKTVLFGGTGGVGKTSLEIDFCLNKTNGSKMKQRRYISSNENDSCYYSGDICIYAVLCCHKTYNKFILNNTKKYER